MTPTLLGRWQTRLFLFATIGVLITLPFFLGAVSPNPEAEIYPIFFQILGYVALFGFFWDILYTYLQKMRWDRDWSAILQLLAGVWEALFILTLIKTVGLPGVEEIPLPWFFLHYSLVWLGIFTASQTLMRVLFPRWRFQGGQLFS